MREFIYRGQGADVSQFSYADRKQYGLATPDTIVEICGEDDLMDEMREYCIEKQVVGYDTETTGLSFFVDRIVLAQIGDQDRQYLIWLDKTDPQRLLDVLTDPDIVKVGLNLGFDLRFGLYQYGMREARAQNVVDVMLTAQVLMCGIYPKVGQTLRMSGMRMQAQHWLGLDIPKADELRIGWEGWDPVWFEERMQRLRDDDGYEGYDNTQDIIDQTHLRWQKILYAADDVTIPIQLAHQHKPWLQNLGLVPVVNLENRFLPVLADIEVRGLPFDAEAWMVLARKSEEGSKQARRDLDDLFDVEVTIDVDRNGKATYSRDKMYTSPEQLGNLMRDWMWENAGVDVIINNQHFKESLERYGRLPQPRIDLLFTPMMVPDPKDPKKKKKQGYPKMKDILHSMWELYHTFLPHDAFILPNTDSKTLKFFKVIYDADHDTILSDAEVLPTLVGFPGALVDPILALRGHTKSASTYGRNWLGMMAQEGRVHTAFIQAALSTGRLSSRPNMQNLPVEQLYRACFKAAFGNKMVGADYSQIEPRVLAHLSGDPTYMKVFWSELPDSEGFNRWCDSEVTEILDLYTEVGKEIGQIPKHYTKTDTKGDAAKKDGKAGRKQAKIANLGLGYGTGKPKFHYMLCIDTGTYFPREITDALFDTYWSAMMVVKGFLDGTSALADPRKSPRMVEHPYAYKGEVSYAETIMGRKRFFETSNPAWWTTGRNMPIQGAAGGDMLKMAATEFTEWVWEQDIDGGLVNLIHDELLGEVREDQAELFAEKMQYYMEKVGQEMCPSVPITADAYIDNFWRK